MKTIAVLNFKGGVGKTVTTATLAYLLAKQGKRILLIDGDSQGNLSMSFGIDAEEGADTLALLTEGAGYYPEFVTPTVYDGIDLIPSEHQPAGGRPAHGPERRRPDAAGHRGSAGTPSRRTRTRTTPTISS